MKAPIALMLLLAAFLTACSRPIVRETVVERPVAVPAAAVGATAPSCTYASQSYSHGSVACQDRTQFRCNNGIWDRTQTYC
jgi:hypothetical protein